MEAKDHATTFTVGSRGTAVGKNLMRTGLDANSVGSIKENWSTGSQRTLEFDGATTLMNFGIGSDIFPQPEVSFEFLFNSFGTTATTGTSPGLIGFTYGARVFLRDDSIGFGLDDGTSAGLNYSSDGKNYRTNSGWIHVICTNDRVTSKVYTNGVKVLEFAEP
jgi:hypothetical protein